MAGDGPDPPSATELAGAGVQSFRKNTEEPEINLSQKQQHPTPVEVLLGKLGGEDSGSSVQTPTPLVALGTGLPALPKKLVAKILAGEYIDFAELPPAKGKTRPVSQALEGQIVVVQAAELLQARKIIPDLATWVQCFSLYASVVALSSPARISELMAYLTVIAKASQRYRWPSWIVYDQNFRQEAAGNPSQSWARVDPSIYAQCFTGQALSSENWCTRCQCIDHTTASCPYRPRKKPWHSAGGAGPASPSGRQEQAAGRQAQVCIKYNKFDGDCKFGKECRYLHICSSCRQPHPVSRCKALGEKNAP